jgi:DNA-binding NarL/FixJ family response regulator
MKYILGSYVKPQTPPLDHDLTGILYSRALSDREVQILVMLANDLSRNEIGELLGLSSNTVRNHIVNIHSKLGVQSSIAAVTWYYNMLLWENYCNTFESLYTIEEDE